MVERWEGMDNPPGDNRKHCREAVCKCDHKTVGKWQFWLDAFHATSSEPSMLCAASSVFYQDYVLVFRISSFLWLLYWLSSEFYSPGGRVLLVISTQSTINLHATGERAGDNSNPNQINEGQITEAGLYCWSPKSLKWEILEIRDTCSSAWSKAPDSWSQGREFEPHLGPCSVSLRNTL